MKKLLLAAVIAAASFASIAEATTYSPFVTANPYRQTSATSGLEVRAIVLSPKGPQAFNGATYNFDLTNIGDTFSTDIYGLVHYDSPLNPDDLIPRPGTATFNFGGSIGSLILQGLTYAVDGAPQHAIATYQSGMIQVGAALAIMVSLADTTFGTDGTSFVAGRAGIGFVNATFTLASIPLPATLPLGLSALGLLGFMSRRSKPKLAA